MYRSTFYPGGSSLCSAISASDQALWDILGEHPGVPVHVLLGGAVRDRVRLYQHVDVGDGGPVDRSIQPRHVSSPLPCGGHEATPSVARADSARLVVLPTTVRGILTERLHAVRNLVRGEAAVPEEGHERFRTRGPPRIGGDDVGAGGS